LRVATLAHKSDSGNVNISERVMSVGAKSYLEDDIEVLFNF
jgi:hypothetical protein